VVVLGDGAHAVGEQSSETFDFDPGPGTDTQSSGYGIYYGYVTRFAP
jgi:hypothetical protein